MKALAPVLCSVLVGLLISTNGFGQTPGDSNPLIAIFIVDGLRPDSINTLDTPTIARLRKEGVEYLNSHSIFPTVTRVNATALATGTYPVLNGIVGNSMFVSGVNQRTAFDTGDYKQLLKLEQVSGRIATVETLGEILQRNRRKLVTVSSGSTGNGFLLNPTAGYGNGIAIPRLRKTRQTYWVSPAATVGGSYFHSRRQRWTRERSGNVLAGLDQCFASVASSRRRGEHGLDLKAQSVWRAQNSDDQLQHDRSTAGRSKRARRTEPLGYSQYISRLGR